MKDMEARVAEQKSSAIDVREIASLAGSAKDGAAGIGAEVTALTEAQNNTAVVLVLAELLAQESDNERLRHIAHLIKQNFDDAFERGSLDIATLALSVLVREFARRQANVEAAEILRGIAGEAGRMRRIERLLSLAEGDPNTYYKKVERFLVLLGNVGIVGLLDVLATEEKQSRRRLICRLLVSCGRRNISSLGSKVMDHRWFLVRNVVAILGQIGGANVLPHLERAAGHEDVRVRLETVKALVKLGPRASGVLLRFLDDKDRGVRVEAIRAVGNTDNPAACRYLMEIVNQRDILNRMTDIKLEAITALANLKADEARSFLKRLAAGQLGPRLREAAALALRQTREQ